MSGKLPSRPGWDAALGDGDTLVITRLSRAMRSLRDLIDLVPLLKAWDSYSYGKGQSSVGHLSDSARSDLK